LSMLLKLTWNTKQRQMNGKIIHAPGVLDGIASSALHFNVKSRFWGVKVN
jgi:hypothetical protein